jgi:transcriptional regulator GlxA family with amidase domain
VFTAAGVSSGIDMALSLVAEEFGVAAAQTAQLLIEYDPQPPFDAGSPDKAPPQIVSAARDEFRKLSQKSGI